MFAYISVHEVWPAERTHLRWVPTCKLEFLPVISVLSTKSKHSYREKDVHEAFSCRLSRATQVNNAHSIQAAYYAYTKLLRECMDQVITSESGFLRPAKSMRRILLPRSLNLHDLMPVYAHNEESLRECHASESPLAYSAASVTVPNPTPCTI